MNKHNGTRAEFEQRYLGGVSTPPPDGGQMTRYGKVISSTTLQIRQGAGTAYTDIGDLHFGDLLEASEVLGAWWHLTKATRNGTPIRTIDGRTVEQRSDCWASSGNGMYIQEISPPLPDPEPTTRTPFTLTVDGYKPFSGELEKE